MPTQNIVFIDQAVIDYESLIAGIQPGTSVVILDSTTDGVEQIIQALQGGEYQSVQIISHGSQGSLQLGATQLNANNLNSYTNQLQQWRNYLTDDADILLYGCNVASFDLTFVQLLSQITGADVAASNDITGNAELGGDWDLEVKIGSIESDLALASEATIAYRSILPLSFTPGSSFSVGNNPSSVTVADFNKDGNLDLAVANSGSNNVSVLLGNGSGGFGAASNFAVGSSASSVTVGDFNKDGNLDLAVANSGSNNVSVLLGNSSGGFGTASNFDVANAPLSVKVGDFNKDGNSDLAVVNSASNNVSVLLGNGSGGFGAASNFAVGITPYSVTVGDFNKDGNSDLAVVSLDSGNVSVLLGNGSGGFGTASNFDMGGASLSITVGDFNKDGNSDLAVPLVDFNKVSVVLGNGSGGFGTASTFDVGGSPTSVTVGDFDKDGNSDLAVVLNDLNKVSVLLGNGSGSFAAATNFDVGSGPYSVTVGDFNKDGNSDFAVSNSTSNNVSVLLNTSNSPNTAPTLNNTGNPRLAAINQNVIDADNSGTLISVILATGAGGNPITDADTGAVEGIAVIAVDNTNGTWQYSTNGGSNWISFAVSQTSATLLRDTEKVRFVPNPGYNGRATISFRAWDTSDGNPSGAIGIDPGVGGGTTAYSSATETASISIAPVVGLRPYSILTNDFDKDGNIDLVTANKSSNTVSVLLGKGDGTFKPASTYSVVGFNGLSPSSVAVADFNKDGRLDLVTANTLSNNISVLFGDSKSTGSFGPAVNFALSSVSSPISVTVGDFNKDGKSDIVTANNGSQNISLLLGDGIGGFATAKNFKVPSRPSSVTAGDFNKDGISDLAVTSSYFNNVSIFLGNVNGTLSSATEFNVGTNPNFVVAGDFNKDNKLDLAVANSDSNNVSILLGNGTGGFGIATNFDVGLNPVSVTVIDFNQDGNSDLAVANADSDTVSVLLGDGNGGFGIPTNFVVGTKPYSVTVGDFNKDGKSDLAVANSESRNVSLVSAEDETYEPVPPQPILINEILFSTSANNEYIELRGTPGATLADGTFLVAIEGDSSTNPGDIQNIFDLSGKKFGSNGLLVLLQKGNTYAVNQNANVLTNSGNGSGWGNGTSGSSSSSIGHSGDTGTTTNIENASASFLLIQSTTKPTLSNDIDSDNNGIADGGTYSNWTVLDSVSVLDGGTTDIAYGSIVFRNNATGTVPTNATVVDTSFITGYVGRSGNTTGSTASDWVASVVTGTAPNLTLGTVTNTSPENFAGQPLNHIGDTNFVPPANVNYAISTTTSTVSEGNSGTKTVTFTVNRSGNTSIASTVYYVLDGTATFSSDYNTIKVAGVISGVSGAVIFATGETTKAITLSVVGEKVTEPDETINLTLSHPNQTSAIASGTVTIVNDDNQPTISIADKSGKEDSGNLVFTVKLSNTSSDVITVGYNTSNDSAIAGVDYTPLTGTITFNPGVSTQTITIPILEDFVDESSERFFVNLTNPTNATITDNQASGTITDNDTAGITISATTGLVTTEAGGTANFSIQLDSQPTADVTLSLSSSNVNEGTVSVSTVTFTAANWNTPQIITVTGVDDNVVDDNTIYQIITAKAVSSDAKYNNVNPDDIDVVNIKNGNQINSIITGTSKADTKLQGTSSDDLIFGFAGNDVIVGGVGNDRIYGGFGTDNLTGGAGNDIFVIVKGEGRDTIKDFNINEDLIALSGGLTYSGLSIIQSGNDTLIKVTSGNVNFALLTGITASTLNASHFITES